MVGRFGYVVAMTVGIAMPAYASEAPKLTEAEKKPRPLWTLESGWCTRQDLGAGGAGWCGSVATGFRVGIHDSLFILGELVAGWMNDVQWSDAVTAATTTSGGFYFGPRAFLEIDASHARTFFVRFGAQYRVFPKVDWVSGVVGVFEAGMYVDALRTELGLRGIAGADGVRVTGSVDHTSLAYVMGTSLFLRWRL